MRRPLPPSNFITSDLAVRTDLKRIREHLAQILDWVDDRTATGAGAGTITEIDPGTGILVTNPLGPVVTVAADIGTGAGQVAAGNDPRFGSGGPPSGAAGGDLGATYPNPTVVAVHEAGASTRLPIGTINDGSVLTRSGTSVVGASSISDTQHGNRGGGALHANATTSVAGFMTGADKLKLDGIAAGAEVVTAGAGLTKTGSTIDVVANVDGSIIVAPDNIRVGSITASQHANQTLETLHALATTTTHGFMSATDKVRADAFPETLDVKTSCRVVATTNVSAFGFPTIDGVTVTDNDRVLLTNQSAGTLCGIYVVGPSTWVRSSDANTSAKVTSGMFTFITEGTANAGSGWLLTTPDPITLGSTNLGFNQFNGMGALVAGAGLTKTGNTIDINAANTSITVTANEISVGVIFDSNHGDRGGNTLHAVATTGAAGFMSAADKTKLNGIATGAEVVVAGAGLTKTGSTLNVIANADASIVVAADDVRVGVLATDTQHGNRGGGALHQNAVPSGAAGFMTGADKLKLDGIMSGAEFNDGGAGMIKTGTTFNVQATDASIVVAADSIGVGVLQTDAMHGNRGNGLLHTVATTSVPGFLSAADKLKLDGLTGGTGLTYTTGTTLVAGQIAIVTGPATITFPASPANNDVCGVAATGGTVTINGGTKALVHPLDRTSASTSIVFDSTAYLGFYTWMYSSSLGFWVLRDDVGLTTATLRNTLAANTSSLNFNGQSLGNVANPAGGAAGLAATKEYVDALVRVESNVNGFRLAPTSDDSIPADGTFSTIYAAPVQGNAISLYNGSSWYTVRSSGASYALSAQTAGTPFDVFAYDTGGGVLGLDTFKWASATARQAVTGVLTRVDGVWLKDNARTRRYLGTVNPSSATQYTFARTASGSNANHMPLWNVDNQIDISLIWTATFNNVTFAAANVWAAWNSDTVPRANFVVGLPDKIVRASAILTLGSFNTGDVGVGIGYDSDTTPSGLRGYILGPANVLAPGLAINPVKPAIGVHYLRPLSRAAATASNQYGANTMAQSGMTVEMRA